MNYIITNKEYYDNYKLLDTTGVLSIASKKYKELRVKDIKNKISNIAFQIWINSELSQAIILYKYDRLKKLLPYWEKGLINLFSGQPVLHQLIEQTICGENVNRFILKRQIFKLVISQPIVRNLLENTRYLDKSAKTPYERCNALWQKKIILQFKNKRELIL